MGRRTFLVLLVAMSAGLGLTPPTVAAEDTPAPVPAPTPTSEPAPDPAPAPDNSKSSLKLLGGQPAVQTVTLSRSAGDQALQGTLILSVRSDVDADGLSVSYFPNGSTGGPGSVQLEDDFTPELKKEHASSIPLVFTMPKGASPQDLSGTVVLQPLAGKKPEGNRFELSVTGTTAALKGVAIQPEKVAIKLTSGSPFGNPSHTSAPVQLIGPGVPALFNDDAPVSFHLLLHSSQNHEAQAKLVDLAPTENDPSRATATLEIDGDLAPGTFEGAAPISSLSPEAPKLSVSVESGNSFFWAVIAAFIGSALGGGLYLASNRKRRKNLLRERLKLLLEIYEKKLNELAPDSGKGDSELPIWSIASYLGEDKAQWYEVKTNAIADLDGTVQTIWSGIHWARSDDDLDSVTARVDELEGKIVRWVTAANATGALRRASQVKPSAKASLGKEWERLRAPRDTADLLAQVKASEPLDEKAAASLVDRIQRQKHWHLVMARAWNALLVVEAAIAADTGDSYSGGDKELILTIGLAKVDADASPESGRTPDKQANLEVELAEKLRSIRATYKGEPTDLDLICAPGSEAQEEEERSGGIHVNAVLQPVERDEDEPDLTKPEREPLSGASLAASLVRGPSAVNHKGESISPVVSKTLRRDLAWTAATALASAAVYVPTFFNSTWGTLPDYVGALAAGFVGKAAINWAALPLFQSLRPAKAASTEVTAPSSVPNAATTVATPAAPATPAAAPATPVAPPSAPAAS
jgi:hypothetical protein